MNIKKTSKIILVLFCLVSFLVISCCITSSLFLQPRKETNIDQFLLSDEVIGQVIDYELNHDRDQLLFLTLEEDNNNYDNPVIIRIYKWDSVSNDLTLITSFPLDDTNLSINMIFPLADGSFYVKIPFEFKVRRIQDNLVTQEIPMITPIDIPEEDKVIVDIYTTDYTKYCKRKAKEYDQIHLLDDEFVIFESTDRFEAAGVCFVEMFSEFDEKTKLIETFIDESPSEDVEITTHQGFLFCSTQFDESYWPRCRPDTLIVFDNKEIYLTGQQLQETYSNYRTTLNGYLIIPKDGKLYAIKY